MRWLSAPLLAAIVALACPGQDPPPRSLPEGVWGGQSATLYVGGSLARIEFGCAEGHFGAPVPLDQDGRFDVSGLYVQGTGVTPISPPPGQPCRYFGRVDGSRLELQLQLEDAAPSEPFVLIRGDVRSFPHCASGALRGPSVE